MALKSLIPLLMLAIPLISFSKRVEVPGYYVQEQDTIETTFLLKIGRWGVNINNDMPDMVQLQKKGIKALINGEKEWITPQITSAVFFTLEGHEYEMHCLIHEDFDDPIFARLAEPGRICTYDIFYVASSRTTMSQGVNPDLVVNNNRITSYRAYKRDEMPATSFRKYRRGTGTQYTHRFKKKVVRPLTVFFAGCDDALSLLESLDPKKISEPDLGRIINVFNRRCD